MRHSSRAGQRPQPVCEGAELQARGRSGAKGRGGNRDVGGRPAYQTCLGRRLSRPIARPESRPPSRSPGPKRTSERVTLSCSRCSPQLLALRRALRPHPQLDSPPVLRQTWGRTRRRCCWNPCCPLLALIRSRGSGCPLDTSSASNQTPPLESTATAACVGGQGAVSRWLSGLT